MASINIENSPGQAWVFSNHETRRVVGAGIGAFNARYGLASALLPDGCVPTTIKNDMPYGAGVTQQKKREYATNYIDNVLSNYSAPDFVVTGWGDLDATKMTKALKDRCPDVKVIFIGSEKQLSKVGDQEREHIDLILCPDFLVPDGKVLSDRRMVPIRYIPHHLVRGVPEYLPAHVEEWIAEQNHQQFTLIMIGAPDHKDYTSSLDNAAAQEIINQIDYVKSMNNHGILISSSPRTPHNLFEKIKSNFESDNDVFCYEWRLADPNNPYPAILRHKGLRSMGFTSDSVSMPCEALIAGCPLFTLGAGHFWCANPSVHDCATQMMNEQLIFHMQHLRENGMQLPAKKPPFCTSRIAADRVRKFFGWKTPQLAYHNQF